MALVFIEYHDVIEPVEYYRPGQCRFRWIFLFVGGDDFTSMTQKFKAGLLDDVRLKEIGEIRAVTASALCEESDRDT